MEEINKPEIKKNNLLSASIFAGAVIIAIAIVYVGSPQNTSIQGAKEQTVSLEEIAPLEGVALPVRWGDIGVRMIDVGVIDKVLLNELYAERGGLSDSGASLSYGTDNGNLTITKENAGEILNLLWALGLSNKNEILEQGPLSNPDYGGAGGFASTGGWSLAKGDPMDHFSKHAFIVLTKDKQELVYKVAQTIYRPCCNNPTHFPDCNHGIAMLGLLQLMASQGATEEDMYETALIVNSFWFPDHYQMLATYLGSKGIDWNTVNPKEMLGKDFSSASAAQQLRATLIPGKDAKGTGCSV